MGCHSSKTDTAMKSAATGQSDNAVRSRPPQLDAKQTAAAIAAERAQSSRVTAANGASDRQKEHATDRYMTTYGGPQIEELLEYTDLVDIHYLIDIAEAGGIVPAWQELPAVAKINQHNAVPTLAAALTYVVEHCEPERGKLFLNMTSCSFSDAGKDALRAALPQGAGEKIGVFL